MTGDLPLLAWARSADPYDACRNVWEAALRHPLVRQSTRLRETKRYPEAFRYLGWCSWEEYRSKIDEKTLLDAVDSIEAAGLPVRWLLVDNGYVDEEGRRPGRLSAEFQIPARMGSAAGPPETRADPLDGVVAQLQWLLERCLSGKQAGEL